MKLETILAARERQTASAKLLNRRCYAMFRSMVLRARQLKREHEIDFTVEDLRERARYTLSRQWHCTHCKQALRAENLAFDHETPITRGGSFGRANLDEICKGCNAKKGSLTGAEFSDLLSTLASFPAVARRDILTRLGIGTAHASTLWRLQKTGKEKPSECPTKSSSSNKRNV